MRHRESGYDRDLFDLVLATEDEKVSKCEKLLRWRGFLVQKKADRLLLSAGSPEADLDWLRRSRIGLKPLLEEPGFNHELDLKSISERTLFRIFSRTTSHGMTGPFDYGGCVNYSFATFKRSKFGVKVPAINLDPGIALLVKVMPLIGCHTVMSCDGHLAEPSIIYFFNKYDLKWASKILSKLHDKNISLWRPPAIPEIFDRRGWMSYQWHVTDRPIGQDLAQRYAVYQSIQDLCYQIMDGGFAENVRSQKQELSEL